ncbi:MAG: Ig-like domain-containing protein [Bradymonadia bacterium]
MKYSHLLYAALAATGCSSGGGDSTTAGEDTPPSVASETSAQSWSLKGTLRTAQPERAEVLAISTAGDIARSRITSDGRFILPLEAGKQYVVHFLEDDAFSGVLYFDADREGTTQSKMLQLPGDEQKDDVYGTASSGLTSEVEQAQQAVGETPVEAPVEAPVEDGAEDAGAPDDGAADEGASDAGAADEGAGDGDSDSADTDGADAGAGEPEGEGEEIDLGDVVIEDGIATPENSPAEQVDNDGDGEVDADDDDDDGDGVPDNMEAEPELPPEAEEAAGEILGLLVSDSDPNPNSQDMDPDDAIEVEFNGAIDPASVADAEITLTDADGAQVPFEVSVTDDDTISLQPDTSLAPGGTYTVRVDGVTGADGEAMSAPYEASFQVESEDEAAGPFTLLRIRPGDGAERVTPRTLIEAKFNKGVDADSVGEVGLTVVGADGALVEGTINVRNKKIFFTPSAPLAFDTEYTVTVSVEVMAESGEALPEGHSITFHTRAASPGHREAEERGGDDRGAPEDRGGAEGRGGDDQGEDVRGGGRPDDRGRPADQGDADEGEAEEDDGHPDDRGRPADEDEGEAEEGRGGRPDDRGRPADRGDADDEGEDGEAGDDEDDEADAEEARDPREEREPPHDRGDRPDRGGDDDEDEEEADGAEAPEADDEADEDEDEANEDDGEGPPEDRGQPRDPGGRPDR